MIFLLNNRQNGFGTLVMVHRLRTKTHLILIQDRVLFVVALTVSNEFGSNSTNQTILVNEPPVVELTTSDSDNIVCVSDGFVQLSRNAFRCSIFWTRSYRVTFNPQVAGAGTHTISAIFTDENGCVGESSLEIIVEPCASLSDFLSMM